ncbi:hypothetical protein [Streptomyces sp. FH025]|uniref:hypothetical protein n=1 Tax=Streptomyces sp. FH025 TaxID=2815937 RepID=UPI001A9E64A9|nr:hypothetical protein [Streptomyces sp. FH025]MBO1413215.1 hypothetical protein [Streptomyces sp. FH025]
MPEQYRVLDATRINVGPTQCWAVRQQRPDGDHHVTVFPTTSLEWRAAEYDIDHTTPDGIDMILDMLLHEPWIADPLEQRSTDPAAAKGLAAGQPAPVTLHNAPDRATARQAHLERIAHAKRTRVAVTAGPAAGTRRAAAAKPAPDPLDIIRRHHGITPEGVAAKTEIVEQTRRQLAQPQPPAEDEATRVSPDSFTTPVWDAAVPRRDQAQHGGEDTA